MTIVEQASARVVTTERSLRWGPLLCLISAAGFGISPVFAREVYAVGVSVPTMLSVRFGLAALVFAGVVAWRRTAFPPGRVLLAGVALGAIGYALQAALFFGALTSIDASLAALLLYVYPALVTVLAIALRKESPDRRKIAALVCSAAGLALLLGVGDAAGSAATVGVVLALGSAATYALYLTVATMLLATFDMFLLSAIVCGAAAVSLGAIGVAGGSPLLPTQPRAWWWIAMLAVFSTVVPVACLLAGMRAVGAPTAAILSCVEPAVTVGVMATLYGERLTPIQIIGGAGVLGAVVAFQLGPKRRGATASGAPPGAQRRNATL